MFFLTNNEMYDFFGEILEISTVSLSQLFDETIILSSSHSIYSQDPLCKLGSPNDYAQG